MSLQDKLRSGATPVLAPGESTQFVIPARTRSPGLSYLRRIPFLGIVAALVLLILDLVSNPRAMIVVTDRRILVCSRTRYSSKAKKVIRELPRKTQIGYDNEVKFWFKTTTLGQSLYIAKRYVDAVGDADVIGRRPVQ
jgi:hypothetical protein